MPIIAVVGGAFGVQVRLRVTVIVVCCGSKISIKSIYADLRPLFGRPCVKNILQSTAIRERTIANLCNTATYRDACQAAAIPERPDSNACDAIAYCNTCQAAALGERIRANACYAVGDCDTCQAATTTERRRTNRLDTFGNYQIAFYLCSIDIQCFS